MVFSMLYVSRLSGRFFAGALAAFLLLIGIVAWDTYRYVEVDADRDQCDNDIKSWPCIPDVSYVLP